MSKMLRAVGYGIDGVDIRSIARAAKIRSVVSRSPRGARLAHKFPRKSEKQCCAGIEITFGRNGA